MKKGKRISLVVYLLAVVLGLTLQAHATLTKIGQVNFGDDGQQHNIDHNLIWDNDSPFGSIVWLDLTGWTGTWQAEMDWTVCLKIEGPNCGPMTYKIDPAYSVTWNGNWRLPLTVDGSPYVDGYDGTTVAGYNITNSEMGHLFYTELGNEGRLDTSGTRTGCGTIGEPTCLTNTGDFQYLRVGLNYWSATEYAADTSYAWSFNFSEGKQTYSHKGNPYFDIAVRPADVTIVPEPISSILFIAGGASLGLRRFWKKRKTA